jgi:DNA-binding NarL/FixJ family response regulator
MSSPIAPTLQELIDKLSPRQMQIAELLILGETNKSIASILSISVDAINTHLREMRWKTNTDNRTQLVVLIVTWKVLRNEHE